MGKAGREGGPIPGNGYVMVKCNLVPYLASEVALYKEMLNCFSIPIAKLTDVRASPSFPLEVMPGGDFVFIS